MASAEWSKDPELEWFVSVFEQNDSLGDHWF